MDITKTVFKRQFAMSMYKNRKLPLGEMTFAKDFVTETKRGDLYPVISRTENCEETVQHNRYFVQNGSVERVLGQFFPYATYEITCHSRNGEYGFGFQIREAKAYIIRRTGRLSFWAGEEQECVPLESDSDTMIVSCRPGAFDVYFEVNGRAELAHTFAAKSFARSHDQRAFGNGYVSVVAKGDAVVESARFYIDNGISIADIRPIRYENGRVMMETGKIYFTASIRMQEEMFQGVFSWVPGTADINLTGVLYYDAGDGLWCGDVAASVLYHRERKEWLLWVCSFNHGHVLAHAAFEGDPRFGVNVIDVELMEKAPEGADISLFAGFEGDEDPDFFYDAEKKKWLMAICRLDQNTRKYRYVFFEGEAPFSGYKCIGMGQPGEETGGSFVTIDGELHFVCGNSFSARSEYRIYRKDGMHTARFDFSDGGFRGWGTVIPVQQGSRMRYYWLTFDRHNGSSYNWSYGNFYCFEAREGE